jgi:hypothetical protein
VSIYAAPQRQRVGKNPKITIPGETELAAQALFFAKEEFRGLILEICRVLDISGDAFTLVVTPRNAIQN